MPAILVLRRLGKVSKIEASMGYIYNLPQNVYPSHKKMKKMKDHSLRLTGVLWKLVIPSIAEGTKADSQLCGGKHLGSERSA